MGAGTIIPARRLLVLRSSIMDHGNFVGTCLVLLIVRNALGIVLDTPADAHIVRILHRED